MTIKTDRPAVRYALAFVAEHPGDPYPLSAPGTKRAAKERLADAPASFFKIRVESFRKSNRGMLHAKVCVACLNRRIVFDGGRSHNGRQK